MESIEKVSVDVSRRFVILEITSEASQCRVGILAISDREQNFLHRMCVDVILDGREGYTMGGAAVGFKTYGHRLILEDGGANIVCSM